MTSIAFDLQAGVCAGHSETLARLAVFEISTYTPGPGQFLWNEAYCCPTCGKVWAREYYLGVAARWAFTSRECESHIASAEFLDYLLIQENLTQAQMEFLIHEYGRCYSYYRQHTSHLTRGHDV